jgi:hypothetical protein
VTGQTPTTWRSAGQGHSCVGGDGSSMVQAGPTRTLPRLGKD